MEENSSQSIWRTRTWLRRARKGVGCGGGQRSERDGHSFSCCPPEGNFSARRTESLNLGRSSVMVSQTVSKSIRSYWCRNQLPIPRMLRQGWSGHNSSAPSPSRIAASLITCSFLSMAAVVLGSCRNPSTSTPWENCSIISMASTMSCSARFGSLKGKHALTHRFVSNCLS